MKISACWIVKNEGADLASSIMSVKDFASELIVVDTGSSDDTVRVAEECGARVEYFDWADDFSSARNYCLSFATGEFVLFLDADEYFEPALSEADRNIIADIFNTTGVDTLQVNRFELDTNTGKITGSKPHARFLRRAAVHYENRIHELMTAKDGKAPRSLLREDYRLMHTGYSSDRVMEKYRRNIIYLETQKAEIFDEFGLFHNHAYLMREYFASNDHEKAFENCRYLLDHYELWESVCKTFSFHYIQRFYVALSLALVKRFSFSRKEIYRKLIQVLKNIYAGSREALLIDLYYQMIFDYRGDRFLRELENAEPLAAKIPAMDLMEGRSAEAAVYGRGALEAYYRRDCEKASRLAETALRIAPEGNDRTLRAIINGSFSAESPAGESILQGDYKTAYEQISLGLAAKPLDYNLLEFLNIVAEKGPGDLALRARQTYDIKRALLDEAIDLSDVVNTGYVDGGENKNESKDLSDGLKSILEVYKTRPVTEDILTLHGLAAPVYEEKGLPVTAIHSRLLLYAKNREPEKHRRELLRLLHDISYGTEGL